MGAIVAMLVARAGDPDKAVVISYIGELVVDGLAVWDLLQSGDVEVRLASGETYLLGESTVLRLA
ncbi:hypothetical protein AKJ09_04581 [Labilithrix luteola]|uniref:Uncharacterized protein n=1 Tax=Labilithrix luteola TaxID=1391654 RepID=A0A0K1PWM4_9BACT|nr:hypothetical protein [Labilithrix luteola]AKU97917.1 hypothetical protein AKJ09_04581 [Labilithrix luteola]